MVSRMKQASPDRRPQLISSRDSVTGIVRFTGNAKLKPWMQILQANFPGNGRGGVKQIDRSDLQKAGEGEVYFML